MLRSIGDDAVCTLNALTASMHAGTAELNYGRKGHIKGSVNVPYPSLLNADGSYRSRRRTARRLRRGGRAAQAAHHLLGTVLTLAAYAAKVDANGMPLKDANGRFVKDRLVAVNSMMKGTGFGADIPAEVRNGD